MARDDALLRLHKSLLARRDHLRKKLTEELANLRNMAADSSTGEILMVAHMNEAALAKTIATREAWFWSRSRKELWRKGITSGNTLEVVELRVDCDQDAVLLKVRVAGDGVACHQGYRSCFYRSVPLGTGPTPGTTLSFDTAMQRVPPKR